MNQGRIGIAVVGAGRIGTLRARLAAKHPCVGFLAVSDRDPAKAKALADVAGANLHTTSNEDIIAHPDVTAVIVSTPEQEHTRPILQALKLGKSVLVEKPIGFSLSEADQILETLRADFDLRPDTAPRGAAPAQRWLVDGYRTPDGDPARVGIIASVTRPFCGDCDRTRLTADGQLRNCLFAASETDIRTLLRSTSNSDQDIALRWRQATWSKLPGHGVNEPGFLQPARPMSAIGG